jgi:hypothetical protein
MFTINQPRDLQQPKVGATAWYGPDDLEDFNWFAAHLSPLWICGCVRSLP